MFGLFWVPRSPTIGAAFADATKLTAPIKPRPTKRIVNLLYRAPPLFETPPLFILFPIQLKGSVGSRISRKERTEPEYPRYIAFSFCGNNQRTWRGDGA